MNLSNINSQLENISGDKQAILNLIDIKIDNDMDRALVEMKRIEDKIDTKFNMLMWAIGVLLTLIGVLVAQKFFVK